MRVVRRVGMTTVTEFEALASICAAVGDAIDGDPALRDRIARVLGIGDRAAASFEDLTPPDPPNPPALVTDELPSVDEALVELAAIPPRGDAAATRLLAIAGLVNADPAYGPGGTKRNLVLPALTGGDLAVSEFAPELLDQVERAQTNDDLRAATVNANLGRVAVGGDVDPVPTRRPGVSYFGRVTATPDAPDVGAQSVHFRVGVR